MARKIECLFFSRGRGHGHAIPDMAIAEELPAFLPNLKIRFVSYATGAETFRRHRHEVVDLRLPEENAYLPTVVATRNAILDHRPDIVVAHEEPAAIFAAKLSDIPSIFISAWLPPVNSVMGASLAYADAIVLFEKPGIFALPEPSVPIRYAGPLVRRFKWQRGDRKKARAELNIPASATVVLVAPGGWASEAKAPIAPTVLAGFAGLPFAEKRLLWLAGKDREYLAALAGKNPDIHLLPHTDDMDRLLVASDLVITKTNRGTVYEAASLGIPTISLSFGLNPIDDMLVARLRSGVLLSARATDGAALSEYIRDILSEDETRNPSPLALEKSVQHTAQLIAEEIQRLTPFAQPEGSAVGGTKASTKVESAVPKAKRRSKVKD